MKEFEKIEPEISATVQQGRYFRRTSSQNQKASMNLSKTATIILLITVQLLFLIPGIAMMRYFRDLLPELPTRFSIIPYVFYSIEVAAVFLVGLAAVVIYADVVFPLVMLSSAEILK
ncbi:hypothetical protein Y032_0251g167 [Ancylostoma ceylanicum]|nr:hypothetical protein Y032_0251g167 [Ancylostoma ceylanicum]